MNKKEKFSWKIKLKSLIEKRVPFLGWIRHYSKEDAISDLVAGITISLMMIPQSIAYASLANLSPKTGLNSAFMGCFIYVFFGTIKEVVIGPTSLMALLTYEYTNDFNLDFVVLLCFLCGVVELIMGLLRLGFLVEFISTPVVSGFTTATSIIIVTSQIKGIIGIRFKSKGFSDTLQNLIDKFHGLRTYDAILGLSCITSLLLLRMLRNIKLSEKKIGNRILMKLFWFLATGRNALAVVITSYIALQYENDGLHPPFLTTREVEEGLPSLKFPPMATSIDRNETFTQHYSLTDMIQELGMGIFVLPIVSVLANVAIAKAYAEDNLDGTQEMLTLALCNIFGSLVQSMPTCGAFTRSAVISASGVKTPLAGLYSACLTLLALKYLAAYFHLIPRATLSAILISAVIFLIDYRIFKPLWRSSKRDFMVLVLTMVSCLSFGVEVGLLFGVIAGICHLVYLWSRPKLEHNLCQKGCVSYVMITPKIGMFYPSMSFIHQEILKISLEFDTIPIILNCANFTDIDYTAVKSLHNLSKTFLKRNQRFAFISVPANFIHVWKKSGCGKLDLLSSEDLEQQLGGGAVMKEEIEVNSATLSIIKESDLKHDSQETIDLLRKEKDIQ